LIVTIVIYLLVLIIFGYYIHLFLTAQFKIFSIFLEEVVILHDYLYNHRMQITTTRRQSVLFTLATAAAVAFCLAGQPAQAAEEAPQTPATDPFIYILDGESLFGYSDIAGPAAGDFSTSHKWLTSASYKVNEKDRLIALFNGSFRKDNIFIRQDEGSQASNQLLSYNLSAAYKKFFGDMMNFKPVFFYNVVLLKETADERLGKGLYDYEDIGGGFENTHQILGEDGKERLLTYGFNFFRREYPNYRTLEALSSREPLEDKEKDFLGYKLDGSYRAPWWFDTTARLEGTLLFKDYTDKLTVNSNGIRQNDGRQDLYLEFGGAVYKALTEQLNGGFSAMFKNNTSNLDFYDTRNTLALTDDRFFEGYYDYHAYELKPSLTVTGPTFFKGAKPSSAQVSWAYEKTFYPGRTAQDVSGVLLGTDQVDRNAKTAVQLNVPMSKQWTWVMAGSYEKQVSNQKFENSYLYSYEAWSLLTGVSLEL
jgi:hypothetical protein